MANKKKKVEEVVVDKQYLGVVEYTSAKSEMVSEVINLKSTNEDDAYKEMGAYAETHLTTRNYKIKVVEKSTK